MKGHHSVTIVSRNLKYFIPLERNITAVVGDSGTGKSSIRRLIQEYIRLDGKVAFNIKATAPLLAFNGSWNIDSKVFLSVHSSILLFDEDATYTRTEQFASFVKSTDCYIVLLSRAPHTMLPYSVNSALKLTTHEVDGCLYTEAVKLLDKDRK